MLSHLTLALSILSPLVDVINQWHQVKKGCQVKKGLGPFSLADLLLSLKLTKEVTKSNLLKDTVEMVASCVPFSPITPKIVAALGAAIVCSRV